MEQSISLKVVVALIIIAAIVGAVAGIIAFNSAPKNTESVYTDFYAVETAVSVSPADYVKDLTQGKQTALVVDLRSSGEYAKSHLITTVNIPAVEMTQAQVVAAFDALPKDVPIVTYCYSSYCMLSRKVGNVLAENGIYVKHMTAGWYEIQRDFNGYVVSGTEPGVFDGAVLTPPSSVAVCDVNSRGDFSC